MFKHIGIKQWLFYFINYIVLIVTLRVTKGLKILYTPSILCCFGDIILKLLFIRFQLCQPCNKLCLECYGQGPAQCSKCVHYREDEYCVSTCRSFNYRNSNTGTCDACDIECLEGCNGPSMGECIECKKYKIYKDETLFNVSFLEIWKGLIKIVVSKIPLMKLCSSCIQPYECVSTTYYCVLSTVWMCVRITTIILFCQLHE